jgi:PIN domain nuclease of toxin-antitoxin system
MKCILDTQAFIWFINADSRLSSKGRDYVSSGVNEIFISNASLWELSIKLSLGKIQIGISLFDLVKDHIIENDFKLLGIEVPHIIQVSSLPFYHRDPFDRLIASQSIIENMTIISSDEIFDKYGINRIW